MKRYLCILGVMIMTNASAFDWQGHRGARGLYPENTILAMKKGANFPITTLELDVVVSKDNKVVVSHDAWMNEEICLTPEGKPLKDKEFNLYKMTYEEIAKFDCGSKVHPRFLKQEKVKESKPLLENLLAIMSKLFTKDFSIEIKSTEEEEKSGFQPDYKTFTDLVVKAIKAKISPKRVMIQSFDWRVLKYLHEKYPEFRTVALIEVQYDYKTILEKLGFNPTVFSPDYEMLDSSQVKFFQSKQIKVVPWTVNDVAAMKKLIEIGVDGIITDYPNLIQEVDPEKKLK